MPKPKKIIGLMIGVAIVCLPISETTASAKIHFPKIHPLKIHSPVINDHRLTLPAVAKGINHLGRQVKEHKREVLTIVALAAVGGVVGAAACATGCSLVLAGIPIATGIGSTGGTLAGVGIGGGAGVAINDASKGKSNVPANLAHGTDDLGTNGSSTGSGGAVHASTLSVQFVDPKTLPWDFGRLLMSEPLPPVCSDQTIGEEQKKAIEQATTGHKAPQDAVSLFAISVGCVPAADKPGIWNREEEENARLNSLLLAATKVDTPVFALIPDAPSQKVNTAGNLDVSSGKVLDNLTETIKMKEELLASLTGEAPDKLDARLQAGIDNDLPKKKS